ncbi:hypothetical protein JMUB7536_17010 [Staphylococcus aureus]
MIKRYLQFVKPYKYRIFATIIVGIIKFGIPMLIPVSYTHLRAHETSAHLVCRLLLEKRT